MVILVADSAREPGRPTRRCHSGIPSSGYPASPISSRAKARVARVRESSVSPAPRPVRAVRRVRATNQGPGHRREHTEDRPVAEVLTGGISIEQIADNLGVRTKDVEQMAASTHLEARLHT